MAITVQDIQEQSFSIDRKGYDVDEVDVFLEHVADEIGLMINDLAQKDAYIANLQAQLEDALAQAAAAPEPVMEAQETTVMAPVESAPLYEEVVEREEVLSTDVIELQEQVADLKKQLAEKTADSSAIASALIVAQRSADDIVSNAKVEANRIVKDANNEADRIVKKAETDRLKVQSDIEALQDDRDDVCDGYRAVLSDFIADAQRKLDQVNAIYNSPLASHARAAAPQAAAPMGYQAPAAGGYQMPIVTSAPAAEAAAPMAFSGDKDLSGFGDALDDFDFDDPE